jgi:hypothetical protein
LLAVLIIQFVVSTVQRLSGSTVQQLNGSAVHRFNSSTVQRLMDLFHFNVSSILRSACYSLPTYQLSSISTTHYNVTQVLQIPTWLGTGSRIIISHSCSVLNNFNSMLNVCSLCFLLLICLYVKSRDLPFF